MKNLSFAFLAAATLSASASAQTVLFDFDTAPVHTSLPVDVTTGGITAYLTATGSGFSIQPANSLGFTPVGFAGLCIYPNSVFGADLLVSFSRTLTDFSILYCSQELGCDDAARMRVTAFMNGSQVGTNTATAACPNSCTWPTQTLGLQVVAGFNSVVVHYDARPPTCQDYGVIFLADNMIVTPKPVTVCPADINGSGAVSVQDIFDFLAYWFAGYLRADINGSGAVSVQDIFDFLAHWFAGC